MSVRVAITLLLSLVAVSSILGCDRNGSGNFKLDPVPELERSMKAAEPFDFAKIVEFQPKSICWNTLPMELFTKFRVRLRTDPWYAKTSAGYLIEHGQYYLRIFIVGENDVRYVDIQNARPNIPDFFFETCQNLTDVQLWVFAWRDPSRPAPRYWLGWSRTTNKHN